MNGLMTFVFALLAVIVGGFVNAKLHPLPDMQLDKGRQDYRHRPGFFRRRAR